MLRRLPVLSAWLGIVAGLQAQPANQQQLDQALELLRRSKPASTNVATNTVAAANTNRLASTNLNSGEGTLAPDMETRARDMLRRALSGAKTQGVAPAPTPSESSLRETAPSRAAAPLQTTPKAQPPITAATPPPAAPPGPRTSPSAAPIVQPPPVAVRPQSAETQISEIDRISSTTLTPEMERKAREMLDHAHRDLVTEGVPPRQAPPPVAATPPAAPAVKPAVSPIAPPVSAAPPPQQRSEPIRWEPPAATPPPKPPPSTATSSTLTPEMETKARQLLDQAMAARQPAQPIPPPTKAPSPKPPPVSNVPAATIARPPVADPGPTVAAPRPVPVTQAPPATDTVASAPAVQPPRPGRPAADGPMTPEQEARARSLIDEAMQKLQPPMAATPNAEATNKAAREKTIKELEKEARDTARSRPESLPTARKSTPPPKPTEGTATTAPAPSSAPAISSGARTKQDKLAALLDAYRRDQIGPAEYHQQRAKILAEP